MELGIYTSTAELQRTRPWVYTPKGYVYEDEEPQVVFHLRPWTRSSQAIVDKRAKAKGIKSMDADKALKGIGSGDKQSEAYTREMADFLIVNWENVVFANDCVFPDDDGNLIEYKKGDPMPCESRFKVFLFEDVNVAVEIVKAAQSFASDQITGETKNSVRSSGGTAVPESLPSQTSA